MTDVTRLPDGSGVLTASFPLPKDHWLYGPHEFESPWTLKGGLPADRREAANAIWNAAKWAIQGATMNGKAMDFDPDALCQNLVVGLLGYWPL